MSNTDCAPKLARRPTWPSLNILTPSMSKGRTQSTQMEADGDIDDDPFAHFLSPVLDDEDPLEDDEFSAGINSDDEDEVESKRSNFRTRLGERWESFLSRPKRPRTPPDEEELPDLETDDLDGAKSPRNSPPNLDLLEEELDGWEADRARQRRTFGFPLQRPTLKTSRTLSGKRHSYVEPSANLWTVDEDDETDTIRPDVRGRSRQRER